MKKHKNPLASLGLAFGLALGVSFSATAGEFDGVTLKVATWGGSWKANMEKIIVPKFEALGGKIEFVTGSPAANFAKLVAGRGRAPFDVMEVLDAQVGDFAQVDYLQPINLDLIPNKVNLQPFQYNTTYVGSWNTQEIIYLCEITYLRVKNFHDVERCAPATRNQLGKICSRATGNKFNFAS